VKSFKRRKDIDEGGAYMVAGVDTATASDATTFVVKLKAANDAFLDYLACPWKPYAVSPTAVTKNAKGDDLAKEWLKTHDAGTGPYVMSEFVPSSHYVIDAAPGYWGDKPQYKQVRMEIIPDVSTQRLKLESGELDMVTKGFATEDVLTFQKNPEFTVIVTQSSTIVALWMNATGGKFTDKALRQAVTHAIDRDAIVNPTYQGLAKVEKNYYTENMFPDGKAPFDIKYDPSILKALVPSLPSNKVDLAYGESGGAPYRRMAELIQTQLSQAGLDVQVRGMPSSQIFALAKGPADQRPDLLLWGYGGDALHVDTVLRIFLRTGAAPLNWAQYSNAQVDSEMDLALAEPTKDKVYDHYIKVAKTIQDEAWFVPFCRRAETIIAHKNITNIQGNSYLPSIVYAERLRSS
jgi:peptide/nickel transport system substrate-binding protein